MNPILQQLKECYAEANKTCLHTRTHPRGCDDCPAVWCGACHRLHKEPIGLGCKFSRMLNDNAIALMNGAGEFIQCHHNPIVASKNKEIQGLRATNRLLQERLLNAHNLWTCEMCGFSMHTMHSNEDGMYSCPVCAEAELFAENWNLKAELKKKSDLIGFLTNTLDEFAVSQ